MSHSSSLIPHPSAPLALLGGTFDPPHVGHLFLAECARHQFNADRVLFLPAGDPYKKSGSVLSAECRVLGTQHSALSTPSPAADRLAMTALAISDNPAFTLDDRETRRSGPTYTVDTLEELHAEGHTNLLLILGQDAVNDLPTWKNPERILELATIAVALKPWQPPEQSKIQNPKSEIIEMPPVAISSTLIRQRVSAGEPIRYLVPAAVEAYIREHHLYRDGSPSPAGTGAL
ncbi:MAG: nicotinate (nicotinamide) nucleotide adenylyltransferase [Anaerolinea sp.]|nr:nicotinate (nicotinamide) nucleotide adenylyltransferase [Anaerolinea sp.]